MHTHRSWRGVFFAFASFVVGSSLRPLHSDADGADAILEAVDAETLHQLAARNISKNDVQHEARGENDENVSTSEARLRAPNASLGAHQLRPPPLTIGTQDTTSFDKEQNRRRGSPAGLEKFRPPPLTIGIQDIDLDGTAGTDTEQVSRVPRAPTAMKVQANTWGVEAIPSKSSKSSMASKGGSVLGAEIPQLASKIPEPPDFEPLMLEKMPQAAQAMQWRQRVTKTQTADWSKCYNFNFDTRYGPGDLVHFNTSQGLEVGQVQDCDKVASTCRVYRLQGPEPSSSPDAVPVPDTLHAVEIDYRNLSLYDVFAPKEKVFYRSRKPRKWHLGQVLTRKGDDYLIIPKRRRGQLLRSLADWNSSKTETSTRSAYDVRLLQMYHLGDPVVAWGPSTGVWRRGRVVGEVMDAEHVKCPAFFFQDSATNATEVVSTFLLRPLNRILPKDYAQVRPFGAVVQVEYPTYQGDFIVKVHSVFGYQKEYYFNQLQKLNATPSKHHGDQVMARDSANGFWYPAVVSRDSGKDPYIRNSHGQWTGLYSIKWLDAKPGDIRKTDLELKQRKGNEVTKLLTEIRPEDCGKNLFAARIAKEAKCPSVCAYWSEIDNAYCSFRCVPSCPSFVESPAYVTEEKQLICARCRVRNCRRCSPTKKTLCEECLDGYRLSAGSCLERPDGFFSWIRITVENAVDNGSVVIGSVSLLLLIVVTWYVDLRCLRAVKEENAVAVDAFATCRRLVSEGQDGGGGLYPLATNLQRKPVAGLGLMFLMNFQCAVIAMTLLIFVAWMVMLRFWPDLNIVGISEVDDARQQCAIAHWGAEVQNLALIPELLFAVFTYLVIFFISIAAVICQRLRFLRHDAENATLKDFAAVCRGLPEFCGVEDAEERVKEAIESHSKEQVLGVSICWDYRRDVDKVESCVDATLQSMDPELQVSPTRPRWVLQRVFMMLERQVLGEQRGHKKPEEVREMLLNLKCSGACFVVFPTELARDKAVASASSGIPLGKLKLSLRPSEAEPDSVRWASFGGGSRDFAWRCLRAVLELTAVIILLMYLLKYPYARYVMSFSYAEKGKPNNLNGNFLMLISIIANQIIYFFSDKVAEDLNLWYTEHKQKAYLLFYLVAMVLELMMDLFFTARTTFNQLVAAGRRTYGGEKLSDLASWHELVQTYVMQNALGNQLLDYALPSTFLAPFLFEPLIGFFIYHIGKVMVRSHVEISKYDAQQRVSWFWVNDLSRYGDVILNLTIAVIFLAIHGGFNARAFGYLLGCHLYIYFFDHWMLLRAMPRVKYNLMSVDALAHMMMVIPTGIVLVCIVFKANCKDMPEHPLGKLMPFEQYCFVSMDLMGVLILVFVAHASLHMTIVHLLLTYIRVDHMQQETTYAEVAKVTPCSWFTANPVHCLRSEHLKKHDPPCRFYVPGREHLLRANKEANCHFEDSNYYAVQPRGWHLLSNENGDMGGDMSK
ncbi:DIMT1 [Symbiodinium natans]|uniref:DIMT1 protein n=1 Tax=Symbiodinium natans TaxID=878477 RepID=A0A812I9P3_9DINO|nr:DIMT1 [Symbiodinium natans]